MNYRSCQTELEGLSGAPFFAKLFTTFCEFVGKCLIVLGVVCLHRTFT